jgi:hypothetical protein
MLCFVVIVATFGCDLRLGEEPPNFELPAQAFDVKKIEAPFGAGSLSGVTFSMKSDREVFDIVRHYEMLARSKGWHRIPKNREAWVTWAWDQQETSIPNSDVRTSLYRAHWASKNEDWSLRLVVTKSAAGTQGAETLQIVHAAVSTFAILNENGEIN